MCCMIMSILRVGCARRQRLWHMARRRCGGRAACRARPASQAPKRPLARCSQLIARQRQLGTRWQAGQGRTESGESTPTRNMAAFSRVLGRLPCAGLLPEAPARKRTAPRGLRRLLVAGARRASHRRRRPSNRAALRLPCAGRPGRVYHALPMTVQANAMQPVRSCRRLAARCSPPPPPV